ncbi:UDP-glucuronosyltransferase 2B30 isoform X2 [Theropithecus gelada]|uniref:UDP-glucuronosyltransferase 2B30 isoform X2 n=1 Tax=Theropithecus gelada TaxID=9565 RepID=UPI000DC1781D|nr:UDP-glucuronosyltransferase 2B30 isoform X2 [Theropithecus gelada]
MSMKWTSALLLIQLSCYLSSGNCGKVLVWPTEFSHWMNIKTILDELVQRGHEVTVLAYSPSILPDPNNPSALKFEICPTSLTETEFEDSVTQLVKRWSDIPKDTFWPHFLHVQEMMWTYGDMIRKFCKDVVSNKKLMKKLQESRFDVVLADAISPCGRPTTLFETMAKAEIWLIRNYWDFQFPHPLLPHVELVGGLHCKPAKPLPKEMEEFVQSSGDNGVVVFSLGSMISNMSEERANVIASALAKIPQKVLWRFDGNKPDTLGLNTQLYKWLPQNDLLGHPKTRAFITHGGANGIYEAIYHGIPMVGVPLFADQLDNIAHMKAKGAAVSLDFNTMSSTDLLHALKTVINDPLYKENAMKLSSIHHDQPVKPLDRAVFWIEFVMRHKGAKHLRVAAYDLTWFQYHSLDVIGFLLACVATVIFIITKCLFCVWKFVRTGKKGKID